MVKSRPFILCIYAIKSTLHISLLKYDLLLTKLGGAEKKVLIGYYSANYGMLKWRPK